MGGREKERGGEGGGEGREEEGKVNERGRVGKGRKRE